MTASGLELYRAALEGLAESSRLRSLAPREGLDFTSNDYLGLAASPRLGRALTAAIARGTPVGAGGSRLLRGNAPEHEVLETRAAAFFNAERALFFGSGYVANYALLVDAAAIRRSSGPRRARARERPRGRACRARAVHAGRPQ